MCGIVGIAGDINDKEKQIFEQLLIVDQVRGPHSTGAYAYPKHPSKKNKMVIAKEIGNPSALFKTKEWEAVYKLQSLLLLGHNRLATKGKINKENAHPFFEWPNVGVHNGTVSQGNLPDEKEYESDSKNIFHSFAVKGVEETHKLLWGAYTLVWHNLQNGTINFSRNSERPLYLASSRDGKTLLWASEDDMLEWICDRNNYFINKPVSLKTKTWLQWSLKDLTKPKTKEVINNKKKVIYYAPKASYSFFQNKREVFLVTKVKQQYSNEMIYGITETGNGVVCSLWDGNLKGVYQEGDILVGEVQYKTCLTKKEKKEFFNDDGISDVYSLRCSSLDWHVEKEEKEEEGKAVTCVWCGQVFMDTENGAERLENGSYLCPECDMKQIIQAMR